MISPEELKKKAFSRSVRGYNASEVDEYLSYIIKNYEELYRRNADLERRLNHALARNEELSRDTQTVKTALIDAKRAAEKIVGDAQDEANMIVSAAKSTCDNTLNEFRALVEHERVKLTVMQNAVSEFKAKLFYEYQAHIDRIQEITGISDTLPPEVYDDEALDKLVMTDIKSKIAHEITERNAAETPAVQSDDAPDPEVFDAANKAEKETTSAFDKIDFESDGPAPDHEAESEDELEVDEELASDFEPITEDAAAVDLEPDAPEVDPSATRTFDIADLKNASLNGQSAADLAQALEDELESE